MAKKDLGAISPLKNYYLTWTKGLDLMSAVLVPLGDDTKARRYVYHRAAFYMQAAMVINTKVCEIADLRASPNDRAAM